MLSLRPAEMTDWARLFAWRNDPETRARSKNAEPVPLKTHMEWLRDTLKSESVRLFVLYDMQRDVAVGTGRLDFKGGAVELSLTVDPRSRGKGYAGSLVSRLVLEGTKVPGVTKLWADVKADNSASLRAFAVHGFLPTKYGDTVRLERQP